MKKKAVQYHSPLSLDAGKSARPEDVLQFLEDFRNLQGAANGSKSVLISMKVPEDLLRAFKHRAQGAGTPYQTQIKRLMKAWLVGG